MVAAVASLFFAWGRKGKCPKDLKCPWKSGRRHPVSHLQGEGQVLHKVGARVPVKTFGERGKKEMRRVEDMPQSRIVSSREISQIRPEEEQKKGMQEAAQ